MLARVAGWKGRIRCSRRVEKRNARGAANDEERGKERGKATKYKVLFVMYRGRGGKKHATSSTLFVQKIPCLMKLVDLG